MSLIGRKFRQADAEVVRELTSADLVLLDVERGLKPTHVKRLRDSHHKAARLIAQGLPMWEVSAHTGLTPSRISVLKSDPSFTELLALYQKEVGEVNRAAYADNVQKVAALHSDTIDEIHDRLDNEPDKLTMGDLLDIAKMTGDQTGLSSKGRTANLNVHIGIADTINEGWKRVNELAGPRGVPTALSGPVVEGEVVSGQRPTSPGQARSESESGAERGDGDG